MGTQVEVTAITKQPFAAPGTPGDTGFRWAYTLSPVGSAAGSAPMTLMDPSPTLYKPGEILELAPTKS